MKPYLHAEKSAKKWGGEPEDYLPIHNFIDSSKAHFPDQRHRALLHNSFGIYLAEQIFGTFILNSNGKKIQVRDIAEDHVLEDMGFIPTVQDYLQDMPFYNFLDGKHPLNKLPEEESEEFKKIISKRDSFNQLSREDQQKEHEKFKNLSKEDQQKIIQETLIDFNNLSEEEKKKVQEKPLPKMNDIFFDQAAPQHFIDHSKTRSID